jgi:hypothetical protein
VRPHLPEGPIQTGGQQTPTAAEVAAVEQGTVRIVWTGREGEPVWIDGWQAGVLPLETEIVSGDHTFRVAGDAPLEVQRVVPSTRVRPPSTSASPDSRETVSGPRSSCHSTPEVGQEEGCSGRSRHSAQW